MVGVTAEHTTEPGAGWLKALREADLTWLLTKRKWDKRQQCGRVEICSFERINVDDSFLPCLTYPATRELDARETLSVWNGHDWSLA